MRNTLHWASLLAAITVVVAILLFPSLAQNVTTVPMKPAATAPANVPVKPDQYMILPPVEYDHFYEGDLTIRMVGTIAELHAICKIDGALACAFRNAQSCVIVMVADEVMRSWNWTTGMLLRHEIGHCNGWPGDHQGQRGLPSPTTHWVPDYARVRVPMPIAKPSDVTIRAKDKP